MSRVEKKADRESADRAPGTVRTQYYINKCTKIGHVTIDTEVTESATLSFQRFTALPVSVSVSPGFLIGGHFNPFGTVSVWLRLI